MILDESRKTKKNVTSKGKFFILYEAFLKRNLFPQKSHLFPHFSKKKFVLTIGATI